MEVKIFVHPSVVAAEAAINEWLSANPVQVEYIGQSQCEHGGRFVFTLSLFYKKREAPYLSLPRQEHALA
jgi:hypothetical protein